MDESEVRRALDLLPRTSDKENEDVDRKLVQKGDIDYHQDPPAWQCDVSLRLRGLHYLRHFESNGRSDLHARSDSLQRSESSAHPQDQSKLLTLPTELRLRIYENVLRFPDTIVALRRYPPSSLAEGERRSVLALLQTCHQVLVEAEDMFYSLNRFRYPSGPSVPPYHGSLFLQSLNPVRRNAIRHVVFSVVSAGATLEILKELREAPNIETVRIERTQSIRFIDVRAWRILSKQMGTALERMCCLQKMQIITPATSVLMQVERERLLELNEVDAMLHAAVPRLPDSRKTIIETLDER